MWGQEERDIGRVYSISNINAVESGNKRRTNNIDACTPGRDCQREEEKGYLSVVKTTPKVDWCVGLVIGRRNSSVLEDDWVEKDHERECFVGAWSQSKKVEMRTMRDGRESIGGVEQYGDSEVGVIVSSGGSCCLRDARESWGLQQVDETRCLFGGRRTGGGGGGGGGGDWSDFMSS